MTRQTKFYIKIVIFALFISSAALFYRYGIVYRGVPSSTKSIEESNELGVFIAEYRPVTRFYKINNSINISFDEVWIEYQWLENTNEKPTIFYDKKTNPNILFKTNSWDGFFQFEKVWTIYHFEPLICYPSTRYPIIHSDIRHEQIKDTLLYKIMLITPPGKFNEEIGTLKLVRVK